MNDNEKPGATRSPETLSEHIVLNCRPQPAIPAVLAMLLLVLIPLVLVAGAEESAGAVRQWVVAAGLASSAGLAIAAGLCSFAPQFIWLGLAVWANSLLQRGDLPAPLFWLLYVAALSVAIGIVVQLWRVLTGRFVPTIRIPEPARD